MTDDDDNDDMMVVSLQSAPNIHGKAVLVVQMGAVYLHSGKRAVTHRQRKEKKEKEKKKKKRNRDSGQHLRSRPQLPQLSAEKVHMHTHMCT